MGDTEGTVLRGGGLGGVWMGAMGMESKEELKSI